MTPEQLTLLKNALLSDTDQAVIDALSIGNHTEIVRLYNLPSSVYVWRTNVPVQEIFDAIVWANMTPAQTPDNTTEWTNRNLQCQSKQLALQTILMGRESINANKANLRAGLNDALTALPSKADGTTQAAGWVAVLATMKRFATKAEAVFAVGAGTEPSPSIMGWEGYVSIDDTAKAINEG